jgi:hypothetical protein
MEITIRIFNPTPDMAYFASDVYVNGERVSLGTGNQTQEEAIKAASEWVRDHAERLAAGER